MPVNLYQSILYDLSQLQEKQLEKVARFVREVASISTSSATNHDVEDPRVNPDNTGKLLSDAKRKNIQFLDSIEKWSDADFNEFAEEINHNRTVGTEREIEW